MSAALDEFTELMRKSGKRMVPIQTEWCEVKEVDWEDKTMTAEGILNGLEYFDILLGIGSIYKRPKVGTKALIGSIANTKASFMIECEAFEEMVIVSQESKFIMNEDGFIVIQGGESLKVIINDLIQSINDQNEKVQEISGKIQEIIVLQGTSPDVPGLQVIDQDLGMIVQSNNAINDRLNTVLIE